MGKFKLIEMFELLMVIFILSSIFALPVKASAANRAKEIISISILHTNDTHGSFQKISETGKSLNKSVGEVKNLISNKSGGSYSLLLDAGDITSYKEPDFTIVEKDITAMDALSYDAMTLGNHEVDFGLDKFKELTKKVKFPVLCANLIDKKTNDYFFKPYVIKKLGKTRIAIFGLTTDVLMTNLIESDKDRFTMLGTDEAYLKILPQLKEKADFIIFLSHLGIDLDREFAKAHPEVGLIIGSHSHTFLDMPEFVNKVCIVQTGKFANCLGKIDIKIQGSKLLSADGQLIRITPPQAPAAPLVTPASTNQTPAANPKKHDKPSKK